MRKFYLSVLAGAALAVAPAAAQVAPSAANVFQTKVLSALSDEELTINFNYNDAYQLLTASSASTSPEQQNVVITYQPGVIDGHAYDVKMVSTEDGFVDAYYLALNDKGFATSIYNVETENGEVETATMDLEYNADGQLVKYTHTQDGETEVTVLTWVDGDISKTVHSEPGEADDVYTIGYGATPTDNVSCMMFYDIVFGVDLDGAEMTYYAGMLGKPTRHLPVYVNDGEDEMSLTWTLDSEKFPTKVAIKTGYYEIDTFNLAWKPISGAGIAGVSADSSQAEGWYDLTGMRHNAPVKGVNIVRTPSGVQKVIVR